MPVLQLVRASSRDTVSVLRCLLEKAVSGKLTSFTGTFEMSNGVEESVFTGRYRTDPAKGVSAALRLSMKLAQIQNDGTNK